MENKSFIKLNRQILEWEWYTEPNAFRLFVHCMLKANYKDKNWKGNTIKRGSFITSLDNLSSELKLSKQQIRTAIDKLISTHELTRKSNNQFTELQIVRYEYYQEVTRDVTNEQHSDNKRITPTKEVKEREERKKEESFELVYPFNTTDFISLWGVWVKYKKDQFKFEYKSITTEQAALKQLNTLSDGIEQLALKIIENSIANGWKGFFKLKDNENGKQQQLNEFAREARKTNPNI